MNEGAFLEDLYQKFELGFFSTIEQAFWQPLHFQTIALSVQYKIPEPQIQEMLLDWAEERFIWLAAWDAQENRERQWHEWPAKEDVFRQLLDSYNVRVKILYRGNKHLAELKKPKTGKIDTEAELTQTVFDRKFCGEAIAEARKSVAEDDRLHPKVGVVIVKDNKILATGHRGESGKGDHGEYCALKKLPPADVQGATVYTTLEPCSERKPPKKSCTDRLIEGKVARVVYGMGDKHESVYGHASLQEAGIEVAVFPSDLMEELLALNKDWADSLRTKPIVPPNGTSPLAYVTYYKPGTSIEDNIWVLVRPPKDAGGFYTVEDAANNVLAYARTLEEIAVEWRRIDAEKVIVEKMSRRNSANNSGSQLFNI